MRLTKYFYLVNYTTFKKEKPAGITQEFLYNDFSLPVRYRRQQAETKFLELIHDKTIVFDKRNVLEMCLYDNDQEKPLFTIKEGLDFLKTGALTIHHENLAYEADLNKAEKVIPHEQYFQYADEKGKFEFMSKAFCTVLGLDTLMNWKTV